MNITHIQSAKVNNSKPEGKCSSPNRINSQGNVSSLRFSSVEDRLVEKAVERSKNRAW